jgi:uncharacterized protein YacL
MRFSFRALFTLILCLLLGGLGTTSALQLHNLPSLWVLPSGADLINSHPGYQLEVTIMLTAVGLLMGFWIGPRIGDMIIEGGRSMERMAATDKIAVGIGAALGIFVSLPFYQLLSTSPAFFKVGTLVLINVILLYLGIVAMMSMKNELVLILSRGGAVGATTVPDDSNPTSNAKILDTNVIIDGRIADVCRTGFVEGTLYVPGFVLEELQHIADSGDSLKRARGRRGLDILNGMQKEFPLVVRSWDKALDKSAQEDEVDTRLVKLAKVLNCPIVTNDFNLNKVAALQGVQVLNVNELANAVKPVVLPGEEMTVAIVKEGKEANQGVAYLDDGTMIVVEDGRRFINSTLGVIVTSVLQTVAGKMIFARVRADDYEGDANDYGASRDNGGYQSQGGSGYARRGTGKKIR